MFSFPSHSILSWSSRDIHTLKFALKGNCVNDCDKIKAQKKFAKLHVILAKFSATLAIYILVHISKSIHYKKINTIITIHIRLLSQLNSYKGRTRDKQNVCKEQAMIGRFLLLAYDCMHQMMSLSNGNFKGLTSQVIKIFRTFLLNKQKKEG